MQGPNGGFPKLGAAILGVPIIRSGVPYWGPLFWEIAKTKKHAQIETLRADAAAESLKFVVEALASYHDLGCRVKTYLPYGVPREVCHFEALNFQIKGHGHA